MSAQVTATLYKCVNKDMRSNHGTVYPVGEIVVAGDYEPNQGCGAGLHFWPTIETARRNVNAYGEVIIECEVDLGSLIPLADKCKARSCCVTRIIEQDDDPERTT